MSEKTYSGFKKPVPKGTKRATLQEAVDSGQLRYYGRKKVTQEQVDNLEKKPARKRKLKTLEKEFEKLLKKFASLKGKQKKATREIKYIKDKDNDDDKDELEDWEKQKEDIDQDIKNISKVLCPTKMNLQSCACPTLIEGPQRIYHHHTMQVPDGTFPMPHCHYWMPLHEMQHFLGS